MMSDKKNERTHTPGPWQVAKGSMGMLSISTIRDGKSWFIADVRGRYVHITDSGPEVDDRISEAEANAHLIAAAPEMYSALKSVEPICEAINALIADDDELIARFMAQLIAHGLKDDYGYNVAMALAKAQGKQFGTGNQASSSEIGSVPSEAP